MLILATPRHARRRSIVGVLACAAVVFTMAAPVAASPRSIEELVVARHASARPAGQADRLPLLPGWATSDQLGSDREGPPARVARRLARPGAALAALEQAADVRQQQRNEVKRKGASLERRRGEERRSLARLIVDLGDLFITQFDGSTFANSNCNMAAAAMLFEVQTGQAVTGGQMRSWSRAMTRPTGLDELEAAFLRRGQKVETHVDLRWSAFVREVRQGRSAVVLGWYGHLPQRYVLQAGYQGAHSVFVLGYSQHAFACNVGFYLMYPLGRGAYDGQWWSRDALRRFAWSGVRGKQGAGPRAFHGNVAFQVSPTLKRAGEQAHRPTFRSYWATAKELLERARTVTIVSHRHGDLGPRLRGGVLRINDPALRLNPRGASRNDRFRWPLFHSATVGASRAFPSRILEIQARRGSKVLAAARGRVIYRSWLGDRRGNVVWLVHGRRLHTLYGRMVGVRVRPGQWVEEGTVLGRLAGGRRQELGTLRFRVTVARQPWARAGRSDPLRFLDWRPAR